MRSELCFNLGGVRLRISFGFLAVLSLMLILDSAGNIVLSLGAIALHELAHIAALYLVGGGLDGLTLMLCEFRILSRDHGMSNLQQLVVAAAGPAINLLAGLVLIPFYRNFALVNMAMGIFQLLPAATLDGDNILKFLSVPLRWRRLLSFLFCFLIGFCGFGILLLTKYNFSVLIISLYLLLLSLRLQ